MSPSPLSIHGRPALEVASEAARRAGEVLMSRYRTGLEVRHKGRGNIVTEADLLAEKAILDLIQAEFPHDTIMSEESERQEGSSPYTWIIDPLDGSKNYAYGLPHFCVAIGLIQGGEPVVGVTYDPLKEELFHAERGKGAYLNGLPIHVSDKPTVRESLVGLDLGYDDATGKKVLALIHGIWPGVQGFRIMGSIGMGLAYVASGRLDLYLHQYSYPWDMASGVPLVREAGGVITDRAGHPITVTSRGLLAGNAFVHADFLKITKTLDGR